jgi:predicted dehydrogenase
LEHLPKPTSRPEPEADLAREGSPKLASSDPDGRFDASSNGQRNGHTNGRNGHGNGHMTSRRLRPATLPRLTPGPAPVRVGVIGCGYWGPQLIRNFSEIAGADLIAVADPRPDRLEYVRARHRSVVCVADHADLLEMDLDAVVVATPIHTHHRVARDALLAGKHVMVEKPLTSSVEEALDLITLADRAGQTLMAAHTFLYNPAVRELSRMVHTQHLGRIHYIDAARLNLGLFQRHVNVLWDLAPHDISILIHLLAELPATVSAHGSCCVQPGVHDVAYMAFRFESGIVAQSHVSWLDPAKVRRITVVGDKRMAVYNDVSLGEKIRVFDKGVEPPVTDSFGEFQLSYRYGDVTIPYIEWQEPLRLECEHFLHCVRSGERPLSDGTQGLAVVAILEAADRSLADGGRPVPVELPWPQAVLARLRELRLATAHSSAANNVSPAAS